MSKIEIFEVGQTYFQAEILVNGCDVDDCIGDYFTTREEAEADGESMAKSYDPERQKRHPGCVESLVREWRVHSVGGSETCTSATTIRSK